MNSYECSRCHENVGGLDANGLAAGDKTRNHVCERFVVVDTDASPPVARGPMTWAEAVQLVRDDLREGLSDEVYEEMYGEQTDEAVIAEWLEAGEGAWVIAELKPKEA